ncbi:MAG: HPP family protein [Bradymonadaceae bacterium]
MNVRRLATRSVETVQPTAELRNVLDVLQNGDFRHVPVVDEDETIVGIVSYSDVAALASLTREFELGRDSFEALMGRPISDFLKTRFSEEGGMVTVAPEDSVERAAQLLIEHRLSALPVTHPDGWLSGIISYIDILEGVLEVDMLRDVLADTGPST